jgi:hypothetical protein
MGVVAVVGVAVTAAVVVVVVVVVVWRQEASAAPALGALARVRLPVAVAGAVLGTVALVVLGPAVVVSGEVAAVAVAVAVVVGMACVVAGARVLAVLACSPLGWDLTAHLGALPTHTEVMVVWAAM